MADLRAPDPTLTAMDGIVALVPAGSDLPVAHRVDHDDLRSGEGLRIAAKHARWFAVPCRECFPCDYLTAHSHATPHLAWQVAAR